MRARGKNWGTFNNSESVPPTISLASEYGKYSRKKKIRKIK